MKYRSTHSRHLSPVTRHASGIALVITLIFVSITAFLAITFLIVTQRERGSVAVSANQTDARFAADTALERVKAEILAPMLAYNDRTRYGLRVSTNFINARGYFTSLGTGSPRTNINYDYHSTGAAASLTLAELQDVMGNLQYNPRVPVYVRNATNANLPSDFRFYLDLNRNGRFDPNGFAPVLNANHHYVDTNDNELGLAVTNQAPPANARYQFQVGDPEWIGILEHPEWPHSSSNRFIARYAYLVVPEGQTLDVNYMHNEVATRDLVNANNEGYLRDQGVGSWELNMAAFFADLNPNIWSPTAPINSPYQYSEANSSPFANQGVAFQDAQSILAYRYATNYNDLSKAVTQLYPGAGLLAFNNDPIDRYSDGPLMLGETYGFNDSASSPTRWAGADNPNNFFTLQDLYTIGAASGSAGFSNRLYSAGTSNSTFDASTYYRMAAQLGTESSVGTPRMNLDYDNLTVTNGVASATNFLPWKPITFFTNAASRLLSTLPTNYNAFGNSISTTNIPVFQITATSTNFFYTTAVHRLLQVAANLFDAMTNRATVAGQTNQFLPSVFRPIFTKSTANGVTNVWVSAYEEITNNALARFNLPCVEAQAIATNSLVPDGVCNSNVYNVPWVVGAKTGLPNFNEFELLNGVQVSRKLEFRRNPGLDANDPANVVIATNQLFVLTVTNSLGNELWNSYSNAWNLSARPLNIILTNEFTLSITNTNFLGFNYYKIYSNGVNTLVVGNPPNVWAGYGEALPNLPSSKTFKVPLVDTLISTQANVVRLISSIGFVGLSNEIAMPPQAGSFPLPRWNVDLNTRVRYGLFDGTRIVDYVSVSKSQDTVDLAWELAGRTNGAALDAGANGGWFTNQLGSPFLSPPNGPSVGLWNQILTGIGLISFNSADYQNDTTYGKNFFAYNLGFTNRTGADTNLFKTNVFYSPFDPYRAIYQRVSFEANDPLVHYTVEDLTDLTTAKTVYRSGSSVPLGQTTVPADTIGKLNKRYHPWGEPPGGAADANAYTYAVKDPLIYRPDSWQFLTNKMPSVGWIGRVHRGTPWQTIYMKADNVIAKDLTGWKNWSGNGNDLDASTASPISDRAFFDLFTAAPNDNADRGRLSINQTNLAAWSAVLSSVIALTNTSSGLIPGSKPTYDFSIIQPAAIGGPIQRFVNDLNATRSSTNFNGAFKHIGDVFAAPLLSAGSPVLNTNVAVEDLDIEDAAMERIPQQIAGLLRNDDPRLVVYAYGQSLKPADQSIVQPQGLCTNYQVTGEVAIRSVVNIISTTNGGFRTEVEKYNFLPPD